jgi:hypothetical protein
MTPEEPTRAQQLLLLGAAAHFATVPGQELSLEEICAYLGLDEGQLRALATDDGAQPSRTLKGLVEELGLGPADFELTPAQQHATARFHEASPQDDAQAEHDQDPTLQEPLAEAATSPTLRAYLLWDNDAVVSAHTTRAGAEAAQTAHVAADPLLEGWSEGRNPMGVMITQVPLKV